MRVPQKPDFNPEGKAGGYGKPLASPSPWQWNVGYMRSGSSNQTHRGEERDRARAEA